MKKKRIYGLKQHLIKQVIGNIELKLIIRSFFLKKNRQSQYSKILYFKFFFRQILTFRGKINFFYVLPKSSF